MYLLPGIFLALCFLFLIIQIWRRRRIIRKVRSMDSCEKLELLNRLIDPFGFYYDACEDAFVSTLDAWQREFGYRALYDRAARRFHMVFDCQPVYFDYDGHTWLIEFWKGQYGINTGSEVGIYRTAQTVDPSQYAKTRFFSVPDEDMLPMHMTLTQNKTHLFTLHKTHWWLAGFRMGKFCQPGELNLYISLVFPNECMLNSFTEGLYQAGYEPCELHICSHTISFLFSGSRLKENKGIRTRFVQLKNRLAVWLFCRITRPFSCTQDRLLFLYFYLPFAFRRTVELRCPSRRKRRILKRQFNRRGTQRAPERTNCPCRINQPSISENNCRTRSPHPAPACNECRKCPHEEQDS